jgi:hypothetical protein
MEAFLSRNQGFAFEFEFVVMARSRGYKARRIAGCMPHDVVVASKRVQCKHKLFDENGRVGIARGQKKYRLGDFDVLALLWKGVLYLIPADSLKSSGETLLTKIKPQSFHDWIDAWHVFGLPQAGATNATERAVQKAADALNDLERESVAAAFLGFRAHTLACWRSQGRGPRFVKYGAGRSSAVRYRRSELVAFAADPVAYESKNYRGLEFGGDDGI